MGSTNRSDVNALALELGGVGVGAGSEMGSSPADKPKPPPDGLKDAAAAAGDDADDAGGITPNEEDEQGGAVTRWLMGAAGASHPSNGSSASSRAEPTDTDLTSPPIKRARARSSSDSSLESYVSGYSPRAPAPPSSAPPDDLWRPEAMWYGYAASSPSTMSSTDLAAGGVGLGAGLGLRHWGEAAQPQRSATDPSERARIVPRRTRASISTARPPSPSTAAASPLLPQPAVEPAPAPRASALAALTALAARPALVPLWAEIASCAARCADIVDDAVLASAGVLPSPSEGGGTGPAYEPGARAFFRLMSRFPADAGAWVDIERWARGVEARLGEAEGAGAGEAGACPVQ
ncbi:hypothetical protein Q8F55_001167 [Vanrija albida]|uniref:Uncharacterized protein n=1 Tax=Vanrija albida TaxID=181172 RepID=A0ABR3QGC6_9TREE